jgi:hypothetical protein
MKPTAVARLHQTLSQDVVDRFTFTLDTVKGNEKPCNGGLESQRFWILVGMSG